MAGYMTKMTGNVYEGELRNGHTAAVENGVLMTPGANTLVGKLVFPSAADTTTTLLLKEIGEIYDGLKSYRFIVTKLNAPYYFVENQFDINDNEAYDKTKYTTAVGELLRAHPLHVGDEFVTTNVTGELAVGTAYGVKTDGSVG